MRSHAALSHPTRRLKFLDFKQNLHQLLPLQINNQAPESRMRISQMSGLMCCMYLYRWFVMMMIDQKVIHYYFYFLAMLLFCKGNVP